MADSDKTKADLDAAEKQLAEAKAAHAVATRKESGPRPAPVVLLDFIRIVASRFGNHPDLADLVAEFEQGVKPPPASQPIEPGANAEREGA